MKIYFMLQYNCFDFVFGSVKRLIFLKKRVLKSVNQHEKDYNLEPIILDYKMRMAKQRVADHERRKKVREMKEALR